MGKFLLFLAEKARALAAASPRVKAAFQSFTAADVIGKFGRGLKDWGRIKNLALAVMSAMTVKDAYDLVQQFMSFESEEGDDNKLPISNQLMLAYQALSNEETQRSLVEAIPNLPKIDGGNGVSVEDAVKYQKALDQVKQISIASKAEDLASAAVVYKDGREKLVKISRILGISVKDAVELATLLKEVDSAYNVLL